MARYASFEKRSLRFLEELQTNNNREWFKANKSRYEEDVLDVALRFIISMQGPLGEIAPHFTAVPSRVGGSLMRVYRDTRFSKNKLPYKTNVGIQFRHEQAKDVHAPGYYVHISPDQVFLGAGMWRPHPDALRRVRERIATRPREWQRVTSDRKFGRSLTLGGESLTRPPRGFDKTHECIEDIKRKSFFVARELDVDDCLKPQFQRTVETTFRNAEPLMRFLCKSVGVSF